MSVNRIVFRRFALLVMASALLLQVSCKKDSDEPSQQTIQEFEELQELYLEFEAASQDASSFTKESYTDYANAMNAVRQALEAGVCAGGPYARLLKELDDARRALTVPEWTLITDFLPQSSMLMIISEEAMPEPLADADRLGAFSGDRCIGLTTPELQPNGKRYFFLQILQDCADEYDTDISITLRYHSSTSNFVYIANGIKYEDQKILGSYTDTYRPQWQ